MLVISNISLSFFFKRVRKLVKIPFMHREFQADPQYIANERSENFFMPSIGLISTDSGLPVQNGSYRCLIFNSALK